jgi:hypothetical protein
MYVTPKSLAGKYFPAKFYENFTIVEFDGEPTPIPKKSLNYVGYSPVFPRVYTLCTKIKSAFFTNFRPTSPFLCEYYEKL